MKHKAHDGNKKNFQKDTKKITKNKGFKENTRFLESMLTVLNEKQDWLCPPSRGPRRRRRLSGLGEFVTILQIFHEIRLFYFILWSRAKPIYTWNETSVEPPADKDFRTAKH